MQKILGIDLGASSVKAVAIEASFRSHTVRGYRAEPLPPPEPPAEGQPPKTPAESYASRLAGPLQAFFQDGWFEADRIVVGLPGAQVAAHVLSLPFVDRKQIDATLPGEVEGIIPFDPEDVVFDSHVVGKAAGKTDILVAIAQRGQVKAILDQFQSIGVDPAIITFSALTLASLIGEGYVDVAPAPTEPGAPPTVEAILDIGAERTCFLILENGQARFARAAAIGGDDVTRALARAINVPAVEAEGTKRSVGLAGGGEPTLTDIARRAVAGLVREIRSTFAAYATQTRQKVTRVRITGGGSHLSGLASYLSTLLSLPVEPLVLQEGKEFPEPAEVAQGSLALALALRGLNGSASPKLNFRRGDLAYAQEVGETRSLYIGLGAMAATLVLLFCVNMWARVHALEVREAQLDATLCDATKKILGKCETDYHTALAKLTGKGSPTAAIPQTSAIGLAVLVSQLFPTNNDAILGDLDISDGQVLMRGQAKSYGVIDDLVAGLQSNRCFKDVKKGKLTQLGDGKIDFTLDATYECGGATKEKRS